MVLIKTSAAVLLVFLRTCLTITHPGKDAQVTCLFHEDCILPCSFKPTGAVVIHWYKQQIPVHSYYYNRDQFGLQNKHFSGRTCLFNSQIAQGNASLVIRKVKVQDRGRYKCYTSTRKGNQETFVNLGVKALIQLVKIEMTEEKVACLSQNIYPAPYLFWNTEPPTESNSLQNYTRNTADSKGLFTIESTVNVLGNISQHAYFCSVVSADGSQVWTASVKRQDELFGEEDSALLIPCVVPQPRRNFTLTWTFVRIADPTIIFTYDSRTRRVSNHWENRAEVDVEQAHVGNASLTLLSPNSLGHTGIYICTVSSFQIKHQVQTWVNITVRVADSTDRVCKRSWWGTAASVFIFVVTISVALSRCFRLRGEKQKQTSTSARKQHNRRDHRALDTPTHDRLASDEHQLNGSASAETGSNVARLHTADAETPKCHQIKADGLRMNVMNTCVDHSDFSVHCGTVNESPSWMRIPTARPHTPGGAAVVADGPGGDRCEPGLAAPEAPAVENDHGDDFQGYGKMYVNEIHLSTKSELSKVNGFS